MQSFAMHGYCMHCIARLRHFKFPKMSRWRHPLLAFCYEDEKSHSKLLDSDSDDDRHDKRRKVKLALLIHAAKYHDRGTPYVRERVPWQSGILYPLLNEGRFSKDHRMDRKSFEKLLGLLGSAIMVHAQKSSNRSGVSPTSPEAVLHCTLRYLAGGSHADIRKTVGVSTATFYRLKDMGIEAINACDALDFCFPMTDQELKLEAACFNAKSTDRFMAGCIGCIDGWLCPIRAPSQREAGNVNAFFSGHYQCYGLNVQAVCDHRCRFTYAAIANPGSSSDLRAYDKCALKRIVDGLPIGYFIAGDNAYPLSEHLLTPFSGNQTLIKENDTFNFLLSQLRIKIEQSFGIMVGRWQILKRPLQLKLSNVPPLVHACMRLHNFIINENDTFVVTIKQDQNTYGSRCVNSNGYPETVLEDTPWVTEELEQCANVPGNSTLRNLLVQFVKDRGLERPKHNQERNCMRKT